MALVVSVARDPRLIVGVDELSTERATDLALGEGRVSPFDTRIDPSRLSQSQVFAMAISHPDERIAEARAASLDQNMALTILSEELIGMIVVPLGARFRYNFVPLMTTLGHSWTARHEHLALHMFLAKADRTISRLRTDVAEIAPALSGMFSMKRQLVIDANFVSVTLIAAPHSAGSASPGRGDWCPLSPSHRPMAAVCGSSESRSSSRPPPFRAGP
jgi:hypothetical protein